VREVPITDWLPSPSQQRWINILLRASAFDPTHTARALHTAFKRVLDLFQPYDLTFVANDGQGAAFWVRQDQWRFTFWLERGFKVDQKTLPWVQHYAPEV
jgi:hypothetical protein